MNFLAHYVFDHTGNPMHNLGLLFPDLLRNFIRRARIDYHTLSLNDFTEEQQQLIKGCLQHIESDKRFHQWEGFLFWNKWLIDKLRQREDLTFEKDWFVAHIFSELLLDQQLLKIHPQKANEMYQDFEKISYDSLISFLHQNNIEKPEMFTSNFNRFIEMRYLIKYEHNEGIIFALGKINEKMGLPAYSPKERAYLSEVADELAPIMVGMIPALEKLLI